MGPKHVYGSARGGRQSDARFPVPSQLRKKMQEWHENLESKDASPALAPSNVDSGPDPKVEKCLATEDPDKQESDLKRNDMDGVEKENNDKKTDDVRKVDQKKSDEPPVIEKTIKRKLAQKKTADKSEATEMPVVGKTVVEKMAPKTNNNNAAANKKQIVKKLVEKKPGQKNTVDKKTGKGKTNEKNSDKNEDAKNGDLSTKPAHSINIHSLPAPNVPASAEKASEPRKLTVKNLSRMNAEFELIRSIENEKKRERDEKESNLPTLAKRTKLTQMNGPALDKHHAILSYAKNQGAELPNIQRRKLESSNKIIRQLIAEGKMTPDGKLVPGAVLQAGSRDNNTNKYATDKGLETSGPGTAYRKEDFVHDWETSMAKASEESARVRDSYRTTKVKKYLIPLFERNLVITEESTESNTKAAEDLTVQQRSIPDRVQASADKSSQANKSQEEAVSIQQKGASAHGRGDHLNPIPKVLNEEPELETLWDYLTQDTVVDTHSKEPAKSKSKETKPIQQGPAQLDGVRHDLMERLTINAENDLTTESEQPSLTMVNNAPKPLTSNPSDVEVHNYLNEVESNGLSRLENARILLSLRDSVDVNMKMRTLKTLGSPAPSDPPTTRLQPTSTGNPSLEVPKSAKGVSKVSPKVTQSTVQEVTEKKPKSFKRPLKIVEDDSDTTIVNPVTTSAAAKKQKTMAKSIVKADLNSSRKLGSMIEPPRGLFSNRHTSIQSSNRLLAPAPRKAVSSTTEGFSLAFDSTPVFLSSPKPTLDAIQRASSEVEREEYIRCICGNNAENPADMRAMICCDECLAWQHNVCMGMTEVEELLPEKYFCEGCKPEHHAETLKANAAGGMVWIRRQVKAAMEEEKQKMKMKKGL